jgi:hypothetical protein
MRRQGGAVSHHWRGDVRHCMYIIPQLRDAGAGRLQMRTRYQHGRAEGEQAGGMEACKWREACGRREAHSEDEACGGARAGRAPRWWALWSRPSARK